MCVAALEGERGRGGGALGPANESGPDVSDGTMQTDDCPPLLFHSPYAPAAARESRVMKKVAFMVREGGQGRGNDDEKKEKLPRVGFGKKRKKTRLLQIHLTWFSIETARLAIGATSTVDAPEPHSTYALAPLE